MDFSFIEDADLRAKAEADYEANLTTLNAGFDEKLNEEVGGLKTKVEELLGEKKTIQEKLTEFAGITDPIKAAEALKFLQENEDAQLIKDGRIDELLDKRTSTMRVEHEKTIEDLSTKLKEVATNSTHYQGLYENKMRDDDIRERAIKAGVLPAAITDVLLRGAGLFKLGKDGSIEARDLKGSLLKDDAGNVVTPSTWIEALKEASPHYWPASEGTGARGGTPAIDGDIMDQLASLASQGKMTEYNALRKKMGK